MSTLDDKILGEKLHYYCSSSEDEDNEDNTDEQNVEAMSQMDDNINSNTIKEESSHKPHQQWDGYSVNTGPKGVIKDWQRYKQFQNEKRDENERQKLELMKKLSLTCRSHLDQELTKNESSDEDSDDLSDDFLKEYMIKRMQEMMEQMSGDKNEPQFGQLIHLDSSSQLLEAIDKENKLVTIVCHIFTRGVHHCLHVNQCLSVLAKNYPKVKFCAIEASTAGMSKHFSKKGVPALLVYRGGNLMANLVRFTDQLNQCFDCEDLKTLLVEHGVLSHNSLNDHNIGTQTSIRESDVDCEDLSD